MIILGVDSTSKSASTAVLKDGVILSENYINNGLTHSQTLMPLIEKSLNDASVSVKDIDYIAVTNGPGSFTGIRIGIANVKGLAFTNNIKCCPVSTLEALSVNAKHFTGKIYTVLDARCNQIYFAEFESDSKGINRVCDDTAISLDELKEKVRCEKRKIIFVGDGAKLCFDYLDNEFSNVILSEANQRFTKASSVCLCFDEDKTVTPEKLAIEYLRLPQAQRNLKKE